MGQAALKMMITGLTADQLCFSSNIRRLMAPRYVLSRDVSRDKVLLQPSLQDKDVIFKMAANPTQFVDIQRRLQTLDFNVNTECDNNGDFLLHVAVRQGLGQLPLLMALVKVQRADIELCNADGMTALMLTASAGNCVLSDVLICLFGADPNKPNSQSGRSALHYATEGNHRKTVECLIRRGADVNLEDHEGLRPDDIPLGTRSAMLDDCTEVIRFNRTRRLDMLAELVRKGELMSDQLVKSDFCVVDDEEYTLIMIAVLSNRWQMLSMLLRNNDSTMNAQHSKTGMTALALAAQAGHKDCVVILLRHGASPLIADMRGYLPLHHAVLDNHESTVEEILQHFPDTFVGLHKAIRMCKKTSIHNRLREAWEKRQEEIVTPKMLGCALIGDAKELYLLLDEGDNINSKSGTGNWPLYLAVENGHLDVVRLLFERGGDIRKRHPNTGATVLHVAARMGHYALVNFLLQYCHARSSSPPSSSNGSSIGFLESLTYQQKPMVLSRAASLSSLVWGRGGRMSRGPSTSCGVKKQLLDINAVDKDGKTAMQLAAEKGMSSIVELLLSHGATTSLLDERGQLIRCPQFEGLRIMVERHRQAHTRDVMQLLLEGKGRRGLEQLRHIWLPKFDHHLRSKEGDTPLMVAAYKGRVPVLEFLLRSAVYSESSQHETDSDSDSDADSGVLDPTLTYNRYKDDFQISMDVGQGLASLSTEVNNDIRPVFHDWKSLNSSELVNQRVSRMVSDATRPRELSIYHDGVISHVCAVNLRDGSTALHNAVRGGDSAQCLSLLLAADRDPLNAQDAAGETVLHTASRLNRRKCVELLLTFPDLDLEIRTLEGSLASEITTSKAILKMLEKARIASPAKESDATSVLEVDAPIRAPGSDKSPSLLGSTVNFDKVHSRYEALKRGGKEPTM
ncbi:ankyrin-1-like [Plakobranchus ocellatus]|uniref:Ankyrin-1-like n=1 Tax=Plakobranchus ocellatus TaxID=259542 RepID=A0AAV3Z8Y0_9GAST|nr:ankyrin-1-like [Plakobranchus ocellatus]